MATCHAATGSSLCASSHTELTNANTEDMTEQLQTSAIIRRLYRARVIRLRLWLALELELGGGGTHILHG